MTTDAIVLDDLPEYISAAMELRQRVLKAASQGGYEFNVSDVAAWAPAQTVQVAFFGGSDALCAEIAAATKPITDACNIKLDFWTDETRSTLRRWSPSDQNHQGHIRVSFDMSGYFSLVGQDSINASISSPGQPVGGRPGQRSLNLGGFTTGKPASWRGTTQHEFLHALGFNHEHQNIRGPCEAEFRWEDDPGYEPTADANGTFVADSSGRRPGIYTYLAGPPNGWSRAKVDHNLRTKDEASAVVSAFDNQSIMLYRFPALFYKRTPSPCAPAGDGQDLSEGDKRGLRLLYPKPETRVVENLIERRAHLLGSLGAPPAQAGFESAGASESNEAPFIAAMRSALKRNST